MRTLFWPLALVLLLSGSSAFAEDRPRKNVVLLIADDLGLQLGCYGDKKAKTPNLDALAKKGVRFTHAFAAVSSCSPSRSTIYTGLHTHTNGQYGLAHASHNFFTRAGVKSLPGILKEAGYRTGIVGKLHVQPKSVYPFDVEVNKAIDGARDVAAVAREAGKFMADCGDTPFALVIGYTDPHRAAKGFANGKTYPGVKDTPFAPEDVTLPYFLPDKSDARADLADYYRSVARLDQGVGMMLESIEKAGRAKDTLVIFLSDNGIPFPGAKTTLYDSGVRLPLLVYSPNLKRRNPVNSAMVSWVDVLPTILEWTGTKAPAGLPGRSFLSVLGEEDPKGWEIVYGSHQCHEVTMYYPVRMIRTRTHKLLRNLAHKLDYPFASDLYESPTWQGILTRGDKMMGKRSVEQFVHRPLEELYDLTKDPDELKNVADEAGQAKTLEELRKKMRDWQEKTNDPWIVKYKHE